MTVYLIEASETVFYRFYVKVEDGNEEVIKRAEKNNGYIEDLEEQVEICLKNLLKID
jgi:hypothetical protein